MFTFLRSTHRIALTFSEVLCSMNIYFWRGTCNVDFDQCMARLPDKIHARDRAGGAAAFLSFPPRLPMGANQIPLGYLLLSRSSLPSSINLTGGPFFASLIESKTRAETPCTARFFFSCWRTGLPTGPSFDYKLIRDEARRGNDIHIYICFGWLWILRFSWCP